MSTGKPGGGGKGHKGKRSAAHKDYYKAQLMRTELNKLRWAKRRERGRARADKA